MVVSKDLNNVGFNNRRDRWGAGKNWDYEITCYRCGRKGNISNKLLEKYNYESPDQYECPNKILP